MLGNAFETARWKTDYAPNPPCSSRWALVVVQVDGVFCLCAPISLGRKIAQLAIAYRLRGRGSLYASVGKIVTVKASKNRKLQQTSTTVMQQVPYQSLTFNSCLLYTSPSPRDGLLYR